MNSQPKVSIRNLTYWYPSSQNAAIQDINIDLFRGEFVVIIGPSGAGKSTFCMTINGLIPHFYKGKMTGAVLIDGQSTLDRRVAEIAQDVAIVFQDFEAQLFSTSARLDVAFGPENMALPPVEIEARVSEAMAAVQLKGLEAREPFTLSGGQKQRLAIAASLAMKTDILCMDEPTTDLDPIGKEDVFRIAREIREQGEKTVILVEHEIEEALNADRILVMIGGQIILDGPPQKVLTKVDFLEANGVMPVQIAKLFHRFGVQEPPCTVDDARHLISIQGWSLSGDAYQRLLDNDNAQSSHYRDVIVEVNKLTHTYADGTSALKGVNLTIREGEFVAIIGQNGSGKTTLARHFNGLLKPSSGCVKIKRLDTKKTSVYSLSRIVGYVFQNPDHMLFAETIKEEVAFGPQNLGFSEDEVKQRISYALKTVQLEGREEEDPFMLTKGERQRIAVASVLASSPEIIILDEPTTGLDHPEQRRVMELLKELNAQGHTIIIITHHLWTVSEYAHRAIVVSEGRVIADGSVREIFSKEEQLQSAHLKPPVIVRLSNQLGMTMLSIDEMSKVLNPPAELKETTPGNSQEEDFPEINRRG